MSDQLKGRAMYKIILGVIVSKGDKRVYRAGPGREFFDPFRFRAGSTYAPRAGCHNEDRAP